jgi:hypothetical protein
MSKQFGKSSQPFTFLLAETTEMSKQLGKKSKPFTF